MKTHFPIGGKEIPIHPEYVKDYDRLLCGGIWRILPMEYEFIEEDKKNTQPIRIRKLTPIQMPHVDMDEVRNGRNFQYNLYKIPILRYTSYD